MTTTTISPEVVEETTDTNDPLNSHIVNCPEDKASTEAWLTEARIYGLPVKALCGHTWVPSRDPKKHPVCKTCLSLAGMILHGDL